MVVCFCGDELVQVKNFNVCIGLQGRIDIPVVAERTSVLAVVAGARQPPGIAQKNKGSMPILSHKEGYQRKNRTNDSNILQGPTSSTFFGHVKKSISIVSPNSLGLQMGSLTEHKIQPANRRSDEVFRAQRAGSSPLD